jgi:hypothetical protein
MTKKFEPTDAQREIVNVLLSIGIPQDRICLVVKRPKMVMSNGGCRRRRVDVPIDPKTFRKAFRTEIDTAEVQNQFEVGKTMLSMAKSGESPAMTMFFAKCRMGFRETGVTQTQQLDSKGNPVDPPKPGTGQVFCVFPDGGPGRGSAQEAEVDKHADQEQGIETSPPPAAKA